ncbi:Metallo-dependent phosphatase [Punctularia strigosozonata HHB-11173 SS5]|uniref:Metallo-dependent phosphatase n=1 Tax=Punctularia strigosozonata (strain HHB-11173) TaxID=741275 RepID=UPI0004417ED4|nr:Metallo-dependent phosphatase [Punctularia strigosozonata HHB-11173 SS5]EIN07679.1 Metallo-dependent phosphatase [Punctularia strigosozonata HHB-11173 SS5]
MTRLPILHFNDVYRVNPFKLEPTRPETIDVCQFASMLDDIRDKWSLREGTETEREGLVLFSGDVFSPSVESSVTRGSHMVPVMNELRPNVSLTGNHDFDWGYPHLCKLIQGTNFPWVLSNIVDIETSKVPGHLLEYYVIERVGVRIGVIGLVEKEWIGTVSSWPANFKYQDMAEVGQKLSRKLRDPNGENCDIIIALTHSRYPLPPDLALAKALFALSPDGQKSLDEPFASTHGVDILLGGHDHLYYISRGVTAWEGYDVNQEVLGAEADKGDVLVVKSGTDFRDLSEFELELEDMPEGSVRRKVIKSIKGKHHCTQPGSRRSEKLQALIKELLGSVSDSLSAPLCRTTVELDLRSNLIRTQEMASSNWFADILRHTYDDAPGVKSRGGADGVFICAGTLRGDSVYGPGDVTLGNILEILPFDDPLIVLELDGETIWAALEASLETWPAQEGRFPVISGFRVSWDSRKPPGQRVLGVWLSKPDVHGENGEPIPRAKGGRTYAMVSREYMAQGHDGFTPLKGQKYLVDDESGQITSSVVRRYLLGSQYIHKMARLSKQAPRTTCLDRRTHDIVSRELERAKKYKKADTHSWAAIAWQHAASLALHRTRRASHYRDHMSVATKEHMSGVDCFDGAKTRGGEGLAEAGAGSAGQNEEDLLVITPEVDGRLEDVGRK